MPVYQYKALDADGNPANGVVDADSPREARVKLKARNLFVTEIQPLIDLEKEKQKRRMLGLPRLQKRNLQDLAMITRQIATLLASGIQIMEALTCVIDQAEDRRLKGILMDIRERVASGTAFSDALKEHAAFFGELYINMVRAGEAAGNLDKVMFKIADYLLAQHRIRARVTAALTYPVMMIAVATGVVIFLLTFVVPRITEILRKQAKALPLPTEILMTAATVMRHTWWVWLLFFAALFVVYHQLRKTPAGRLWVDSMWLKVPVLGTLLRKSSISRFAITFSTLLESGLPAVEGLSVVKKVVGNELIAQVIEKARERILEGSDIATPFRQSNVFPPVVVYMMNVGEESGQLPELLRKVSQAYDEEVEIQAQRLTSLLEPLLIVAMAGIVAFIVLSVLLPVLQMSKI